MYGRQWASSSFRNPSIGALDQMLLISASSESPDTYSISDVMCMRLAQASVNFTANSRLPKVAGWDHLLPAWFTKLHAKYRIPVNSILFVGAMMLAMGLAGIVGVGEQEAFQLLQNAAGSLYAITYLVMFAIPIIGLRGVEPRPPLWLKIAAGAGFLMTLLYVVVSVIPIVQSEEPGVVYSQGQRRHHRIQYHRRSDLSARRKET
jgi:amino acid transporter